ncbi:hypothetical protein [Bradyrhizobium cenepequi]|uniref:hypothetical protein n=1 Tax=Bradyrhizobium cenepequi TaxID=2821403 RepID=UPI001CE3824F|nr:hypothetical protein [Bradyrhizobium cenepequi]MCA6108112.1 hypothetical protein [Bradyrhizobium cenepequi]
MSNIVPIRDGGPALTDIPGMLRRMADQVEAGEFGKVSSAILLIPQADGYPLLFGWGDIEGRNDPIIQCEMAKHWLVENITGRK